MKLGDIFDYTNDLVYIEYRHFCDEQGYTLKEVEPKDNVRRFQVCEQEVLVISPQIKINELKSWFDRDYTQQEQKLRRLIDLELLCDDGSEPKVKLKELYVEAEKVRKQIQELEGEI